MVSEFRFHHGYIRFILHRTEKKSYHTSTSLLDLGTYLGQNLDTGREESSYFLAFPYRCGNFGMHAYYPFVMYVYYLFRSGYFGMYVYLVPFMENDCGRTKWEAAQLYSFMTLFEIAGNLPSTK